MNPLHTIAFPVDIIAPTIPFYITTSGTTKILLGNPGGAHWLSIPREDDESASTALAISFPSRFYWLVGGLHRGFARSSGQAEAITFLLTDNKPPPMAVGEWMADSDLETRSPLMDEVTGRIVELTAPTYREKYTSHIVVTDYHL